MSRRHWGALCVAALLGSGALAQAADPLMPYEVQAGDTLYTLAQRYLHAPEDWRELARLNGVRDPRRLPIGSTLLFPGDRLRGVVRQATVLYLKGLAEAGEPPRALQVGDRLDEGTALHVREGAFLGLGLADGSTLHLPAHTRLTLERLREADGIGGQHHRLRLDQGRVDSRVQPQPKGSRFDVRTPQAVTGVRGTRFGVGLAEGGASAFTEVVTGLVAVAATGLPQAPVEVGAGQGAVVSSATQAPRVRALLPAPALGASELRVGRLPHALSLAPLPGAVGYRVQVAQGPAGDGPERVLFDEVSRGAAPRLSGLPDGEYRLRVRAVDAEGLMGAEATARLRLKSTPVPPLARSPGAHAVVSTGTVALRCTEVPGAVAYELQVSADPAFGTLLAQARANDRCAFSVPMAQAGEVHWRVASLERGADGGVERGPFGDPSPLWVEQPPAAPLAVQEAEDGLGLHWAGVAGQRYLVQVASDLAFERLVHEVEVERPSVRLDLPACQAYFVRLRTLSAHGLSSPFSEPRRLGERSGLCSSGGAPVRSSGGADWGSPAR